MKKILLLCNTQPVMAETIQEHIAAFGNLSKHDVTTCSMFGDIPDTLLLHQFDVLIIHYSICIGRGGFLSFKAKEKIRHFKGYKVVFVQDDFRWIYSTVMNCYFLGINALFGLAEQSILNQVYPKHFLKNVHVDTVLTGYVSSKLQNQQFIPYSDRRIDVSYRARKLPFWIGRHAMQKWQIAESFLAHGDEYKLNCDISVKEEDRVYGQAWSDLLMNSKATLGTESGSGICDFTGKLQKNIDAFTAAHPNATFEEVEKKFLNHKENHVLMNVISPRIFEAISHKVLLILYPGAYSHILIPWKHYVPLKQDHSNIEEVVAILRSPEKAQEIIDCAYRDILFNPAYAYQALIDKFDAHIDKTFKNRRPTPVYKRIQDFILRKISDKDVPTQSNLDILSTTLIKLKQLNFFDFRLNHLDSYNGLKSCEIFCSLKMENKPLQNMIRISTLKANEPISVNFIYSEYATAFLDSLSEISNQDSTTLNGKFLKLLLGYRNFPWPNPKVKPIMLMEEKT